MEQEESFLIICSTHYAMRDICTALELDVAESGVQNVGKAIFRGKTLYITRLQFPRTDFIQPISNQLRANTVLVVNRGMDQEMFAHYPPNYYLINCVENLEQCLNVELSNSERDKLSRRVLYARAHSDEAPIDTAAIVFHFLFPEPVAQNGPPPRTAVPRKWEDQLKEPEQKRAKTEDTDEGCVVCMDKHNSIMFTPCAHQCVCDVCAREIMERNDLKKECPVCRSPIEDLYRPLK